MAAQAGKAAPVVAIAGALVAASGAQQALAAPSRAATMTTRVPQAQRPPLSAHQPAPAPAATTDSISARAFPVTATVRARHAARARNYTVRTGDTLSAIAERYYHKAADWQYLYHANDKTVTNPNLIYAGQTLVIPATAPAHYTLADYVPRHARTASTPDTGSDDSGAAVTARTVTATRTAAGGGGGGGSVVVQSASQGGTGSASGLSGTLSCSGLEQLWDTAGGNPADAFVAAEIAMAESGGNQYALSPTDDYGYWQINASNGPLATFDAYGNARSAIVLSHDGTDWSPWTTYTSGAYIGRC